MDKIRRQLRGVDQDLIFNVDETGMLYSCLPSPSEVPVEDRRRERGSKAMKSKTDLPSLYAVVPLGRSRSQLR